MSTHYDTLGIPQTASPDEITRAFRAKAKQFHPDHNPGQEDQFKRINEAYQTLRDPTKRAQYDWTRGLGSQKRARKRSRSRVGFDAGVDYGNFADSFFQGFKPPRSKDFFKGDSVTDLFLTLEEAHLGVKKEVSVFIQDQASRGLGTRKSFTVTVPPGTLDETTLRLAGQGGRSFSFDSGWRDADVLIRIKLKPDPRFRLEKADLHLILRVSPSEAALGSKKSIDTLDGILLLTVPPGIQGGHKLRLRGKGIGGKGDLFVEIRIKIPKDLSEEQQDLYKRLADLESQ
jgi:curved DNA-binding protein